MQYILSEEEYSKLIHKDRIRFPIDEFKKSLQTAYEGSLNKYADQFLVNKIKEALTTLNIKLDL